MLFFYRICAFSPRKKGKTIKKKKIDNFRETDSRLSENDSSSSLRPCLKTHRLKGIWVERWRENQRWYLATTEKKLESMVEIVLEGKVGQGIGNAKQGKHKNTGNG